MIKLNVVIKGLTEWEDLLTHMDAFVAHPFRRTLAEKIRDDYADEVLGGMASQGKAFGQPWPPLAPSTVAQKARFWPGRPPLVRTGEMANSLTRPSHPKFLFRHTAKKVTLGSRDPVAPFHQAGTRRMPARPVFILNKKMAQRWTEGVLDDWHERLKGTLGEWIG